MAKKYFHALLCALLLVLSAARMPYRSLSHTLVARSQMEQKKVKNFEPVIVAAVLPGSPLVTGTVTQGICNGISIFSNILLLRFALSWFPQIQQQFPILRPINTLTEPYLRVFRRTIPPIGGFDISALPAIFILDILSQTTVAIGAEIPSAFKGKVFKPKRVVKGKSDS